MRTSPKFSFFISGLLAFLVRPPVREEKRRYRLRGNSLAAAGESHLLRRRRLDADPVAVQAGDRRQAVGHGLVVRGDAGAPRR